MSILNLNQRAVIRIDTGIDQLIIDRVVEAYDALLAGNLDEYKMKMGAALAQQNIPVPIPDHERPTAIDKIKTICIKAIADERHWDFKRAAKFLADAGKQ
jgi:hypothetical protein